MKKPVVRPIEHKSLAREELPWQGPECNGTGFAAVDQPGRPGIRIYPGTV
jgi:hypothetical protein